MGFNSGFKVLGVNKGIPAVLVVVKAVSRSGYNDDSYHAGLVYITI
jgi:hypothetical protein